MAKTKWLTSVDRSNMFYWQGDRPFDELETKEIFLDRHNNFNPQSAREAIEYGMKQAGKNQNKAKVKKLYSMIPFGSVNVVIKAKLADNTDVLFRGHPPEIKNGYFWAESVASHEAKKAGVPSYKTYFIDDTRRKFNFDYMLIECLPGKTMKAMWPISKKLDQKLIKETGYYLAKIHTVKPQKFGFFDNQLAKKKGKLIGIHPQWKNHLYAALPANLDYLIKTRVISLSQKKKIEKIFESSQNLMKFDNPVLIQNDLADWNQLVYHNKVSAILDWDECYSGDPVADFSAWSLFFDDARMKHLINGYNQVLPLPDNFEDKLHLYRMRYLVSKIAMRKKKLVFHRTKFFQDLLNRGLTVMKEEFRWYGL